MLHATVACLLLLALQNWLEAVFLVCSPFSTPPPTVEQASLRSALIENARLLKDLLVLIFSEEFSETRFELFSNGPIFTSPK